MVKIEGVEVDGDEEGAEVDWEMEGASSSLLKGEGPGSVNSRSESLS